MMMNARTEQQQSLVQSNQQGCSAADDQPDRTTRDEATQVGKRLNMKSQKKSNIGAR
jgi:hypothetical protein